MKKLIAWAKAHPVLFLVIATLATRLLAVAVLDAKSSILSVNFDAASAGEQAQMARGLLHTGTFTYFVIDGKAAPSAYQPPLYPAFLAAIFSFAGDKAGAFVVVQIVQCFAGILTVLLTYGLARRFLPDGYSLLCGTLAAFWPTLVYMPNEAHPISFLIPVILWIVLLTVDLIQRGPSFKLYVLLGFAFSLGLMMRSELIVPLLVTALGLFITHRRQAVAGLVACLALCFVVQAAWMYRNLRTIGKPVLTTTAGLNLFRGNGPTATGGSYQWDGQIVWETPQTIAEAKALHWSPDYELKLDDVYMRALKDSLKDDPLRPLKLAPAKLLFFWTSDFTHPKGKQPAAWLAWIIVLPAIIYGIVAMWRRRREAWPLFLWPAFYMLVVLALFALPRYRLNVEPIFLVFATAGIQAFRERRNPKTA